MACINYNPNYILTTRDYINEALDFEYETLWRKDLNFDVYYTNKPYHFSIDNADSNVFHRSTYQFSNLNKKDYWRLLFKIEEQEMRIRKNSIQIRNNNDFSILQREKTSINNRVLLSLGKKEAIKKLLKFYNGWSLEKVINYINALFTLNKTKKMIYTHEDLINLTNNKKVLTFIVDGLIIKVLPAIKSSEKRRNEKDAHIFDQTRIYIEGKTKSKYIKENKNTYNDTVWHQWRFPNFYGESLEQFQHYLDKLENNISLSPGEEDILWKYLINIEDETKYSRNYHFSYERKLNSLSGNIFGRTINAINAEQALDKLRLDSEIGVVIKGEIVPITKAA